MVNMFSPSLLEGISFFSFYHLIFLLGLAPVHVTQIDKV